MPRRDRFLAVAAHARLEFSDRLMQPDQAVFDELHEGHSNDRLCHRREEEVALRIKWPAAGRERRSLDEALLIADREGRPPATHRP